MNDWTSGYVADISYTYGYYSELNPNRSRLALLTNGIPCNNIKAACELGYGQGVSANIHASASTSKWFGTDFNPSQAGFAQELAQISENQAKLFDEAFAEFCNRDDLPDFDFIGIHGIWSWISDANREILVDFISRKLKVGGLLYISYNTMPGWASFAPVRKIMTQHAEIIGSEGVGIVSRIEGALVFAEGLFKTNPQYLAANPQLLERLEKLKKQDRHYLAHEYFNRDWNPMHFSDMAEVLASAKLDYACSANFLNHLDGINFTDEQRKFLSDIPDVVMQQSVRDFIANTQFRQDYWVKGKRKIPYFDQLELLRHEKVILCVYRDDISLKFNCLRGEANLNETIYASLLNVLEDYQIHTIGEIADRTKEQGILLQQIVECLITLTHRGQVLPVVKGDIEDSSVQSCNKLNARLMNLSRSNSDQSFLASPVTGGGIYVPRIQQLFLLAYFEGEKTAEGMADFTWKILGVQNEKMIQDGDVLESVEENLQRLRELAIEFLEKKLMILLNLRVFGHSWEKRGTLIK